MKQLSELGSPQKPDTEKRFWEGDGMGVVFHAAGKSSALSDLSIDGTDSQPS